MTAEGRRRRKLTLPREITDERRKFCVTVDLPRFLKDSYIRFSPNFNDTQRADLGLYLQTDTNGQQIPGTGREQLQ